MSEDVRAAVGKMSRVLRMAKDRANTQFGKVRERAKRFSLGGSPTTSQSAPSAESSSAFMEDPDQKVKQLMDLGFSEAAARHALRACGGHLDIAGPWLLDEHNADELLAAEVAAQEVGSPARPPLAAGGRARVTGLQTASAAALNGSDVLLQKWDAASQRWIVSMPDGTVKSIRPQNLDPLYASPHGPPVHEDEPAEQTEQTEQRYSAGQPEQSGQHQAGPASASAAAPDDERSDIDREELKSLARTMLESTGQPSQQSVTDEVLEALSEADLLELIDGLSRDLFVRTDGQHDAQEAQEAPARPDVAGKIVELELEETRLRSLAEAQAKRAEELEAREAALQEAEAALERRRSEGKEPTEASAPAVRIPFAAPKEETQDASPTSTTLEAERAELQRLREEVEAAAKDLELRQEAAKRAAEERELQFLEEESAQMKLASSLKEEEARLRMQRRSLGMLQQAILKGAADVHSSSGYVEHTMNDDTEQADAQGVLQEGHPRGDAAAEHGCVDQREDDEVWDLDWSAVRPANDGKREES